MNRKPKFDNNVSSTTKHELKCSTNSDYSEDEEDDECGDDYGTSNNNNSSDNPEINQLTVDAVLGVATQQTSSISPEDPNNIKLEKIHHNLHLPITSSSSSSSSSISPQSSHHYQVASKSTKEKSTKQKRTTKSVKNNTSPMAAANFVTSDADQGVYQGATSNYQYPYSQYFGGYQMDQQQSVPNFYSTAYNSNSVVQPAVVYSGASYQTQGNNAGFAQQDYNSFLTYQQSQSNDYIGQSQQQASNYLIGNFNSEYLANRAGFMSQLGTAKSNGGAFIATTTTTTTPLSPPVANSTPSSQSLLVANVLSQFQSN